MVWTQPTLPEHCSLPSSTPPQAMKPKHHQFATGCWEIRRYFPSACLDMDFKYNSSLESTCKNETAGLRLDCHKNCRVHGLTLCVNGYFFLTVNSVQPFWGQYMKISFLNVSYHCWRVSINQITSWTPGLEEFRDRVPSIIPEVTDALGGVENSNTSSPGCLGLTR